MSESQAIRVMTRIWKQMTHIYGYLWTSSMGSAIDEHGLSDAAITWRKGLAGITLQQLNHALDSLVISEHKWPPSLPEFRGICESKNRIDAPTLDEVVMILATVSARKGTIAKRYKHPLALAISSKVDMYLIRSSSTEICRKMVKPVYDEFLRAGRPDWPAHAKEDQAAISRKRSERTAADREEVLAGLSGIGA